MVYLKVKDGKGNFLYIGKILKGDLNLLYPSKSLSVLILLIPERMGIQREREVDFFAIFSGEDV